jgi:hypothetical protein
VCLTTGLGEGGRHGDGVEVAVKSGHGEVVGHNGMVAAVASPAVAWTSVKDK